MQIDNGSDDGVSEVVSCGEDPVARMQVDQGYNRVTDQAVGGRTRGTRVVVLLLLQARQVTFWAATAYQQQQQLNGQTTVSMAVPDCGAG